MRILLDECVPWPMSRLLSNHSCTSVQARGWGGIKNGDLLERAEAEFDLFITSDQNIRYQQNLTGRKISIVVLLTTSWPRIKKHTTEIAQVLDTIPQGGYVEIPIS